MECRECKSTSIRKNTQKKGKQNHTCANCDRQFIINYEPTKGYTNMVNVSPMT